jgi:hypothetical protein
MLMMIGLRALPMFAKKLSVAPTLATVLASITSAGTHIRVVDVSHLLAVPIPAGPLPRTLTRSSRP